MHLLHLCQYLEDVVLIAIFDKLFHLLQVVLVMVIGPGIVYLTGVDVRSCAFFHSRAHHPTSFLYVLN